MTTSEHLLDCLVEESAEVLECLLAAQLARVQIRASKALRFGLLETQPGQLCSNKDRLEHELRDLETILIVMYEHGVIGPITYSDEKAAKVREMLEYSKRLGTLEDGM